MRYIPLLALLLVAFAACKKTTESPQASTTPTSDFRSDIVGEYRLTLKEIHISHPDMKPKDTTETSLTDDVTISYSISDSTRINSMSYLDTVLPAITFKWHSTGKTDTFGMLAPDHLCGDGSYSQGWIINKDSISYYKSESGVSFDWRAYINGRRK